VSSEEKKDKYLQYGGQAVIEGVMMRSPRYFAVACRKPDGQIVVQEEPVDRSIVGKFLWMNRPLLRGTLALIDAMALGMKALKFAADVQTQSLGGPDTQSAPATVAVNGNGAAATAEPAKDHKINDYKDHKINDYVVGGTMVFSICFGIALFVALPTLLTQAAQYFGGLPHGLGLSRGQQIELNLVDGVVRMAIFLGYIGLISRLDAIRRVFQFHGAEHKAINTLEAGEPLTPENCMRESRIHPRCGTSFIIVVLLASILVHSVLPRPPFYFTRLALHIALIPVVAGISYEIIKLAGRYRHSAIMRTLLAPGLWSQRLTTREPDVEHVEVAIAALQAVLAREKAHDAGVPEAQSPLPLEVAEPSAAIA
jgi:uncharacterized protein YqhQ